MNYVASGMLCAAGSILLVGCDQSKPADSNSAETVPAAAAVDHNDPIASAMAAAPETIARDATIVQAAADGSMKTLRAGNNGWTCMPDNPKTPGHDPMCMDANAMKWAEAWMTKKTPPADNVGLMYMLAGGSDASNMDPYGEKPADGKWVETGPHVMIVGSESLNRIYPATAAPDTAKPYVMFGGTPYAHMMIPIK
jgi:hypothetical protein